MNLIQWKRLIRDFKEERCILMLGPRMPGVQVEGEWRSINEEFSRYLTSYLDDSGVEYDKESERELPYITQQFLNIEGARRVDLEDIAKDFLETNTKTIPDFYYQLAELPVHLIINTTPDDYMERALREKGKPCLTYHYNFQREANFNLGAESISTACPMVYNLFGSMKESESLVLTDSNQLEFIRNVVKDDPRIPDEILGHFDHRKTYLFLGFNLENWQFRLLLDSLNLREENSTFSPKTPFYPVSTKTKEFYAKRFSFIFVEKDLKDFVAELNEKTKPAISEETTGAVAQKVFLINDPDDLELQIECEKWLKQMEKNGLIEIWHREKFEAGTDRDEILDFLKQCDCILPLLSPDLLANSDLYEQELALALQLSNEGKKVYPVLLRHCDWQSDGELKKLAVLPVNQHPVTDAGDWNSRDEAWLDIISELKKRLSR